MSSFKHLKVNDATIKGSHCKVWGHRNLVLGAFVEVYGNDNTCNGAYAEVYGNNNTCRGAFSKTYGKHNTCTGDFSQSKTEIPSGMPPAYTSGTPPIMVTQTFTNTDGDGKLTQTFINCDSSVGMQGLLAVGGSRAYHGPEGSRAYHGLLSGDITLPCDVTLQLIGDHGLKWTSANGDDENMAHLSDKCTIDGVPWPDFRKAIAESTVVDPVASLKHVKAEVLSDDDGPEGTSVSIENTCPPDTREQSSDEKDEKHQGTKRKRTRSETKKQKVLATAVKKLKVSTTTTTTTGPGQCGICMVNKSTVAFIPCGHVCSCPICAKKLAAIAKTQRKPMTCPICIKPVKRAQRIFMST